MNLEHIRSDMQNKCESGDFFEALSDGFAILNQAPLQTDENYWEIRDLIRRIYLNGVNDSNKWESRVLEDKKDFDKIISSNGLPATLSQLYSNVIEDRLRIYDIALEEQPSPPLLHESATMLEHAADLIFKSSSGSYDSLSLYERAARRHIDLDRSDCMIRVAKKGIEVFISCFPRSHSNYRAAAEDLASPFCDMLNISIDELIKPTTNDFRVFFERGDARSFGEALSIALQLEDSHQRSIAGDMIDLLSKIRLDLEEHPQHKTLYNVSESDLNNIQELFVKHLKQL